MVERNQRSVVKCEQEVRKMSFNKKLQKLRKENGLSQEGLADLLDVTRQSVSKWESGTTYPEMDKLLSMCKIFKCSLDDLTNDEITEIKIDEKKKSNIYTFVDSILELVNETNDLRKSMTKKELMTCIVVMGITALILLLFRFLFSDIEKLFHLTIHSTQNDLFQIGSHIIQFVINCCYWSLFLVIFIYVFRILYLDNPKYKRRKYEEKEDIEKTEVVVEKVKIVKEEKKIANNIDILFHFLEKIVMFFVKSFICFIILLTLFILFFLCAGLFIYLFYLFKGVFYISVLVGITFGILLVLTILEILINLIIKRKTSEKRLMITFLASVVGLGSSFGILLLDMSSLTFVDEVPEQISIDTISKTYEMKNDMHFLFWPKAEYMIDDTLGNEVKIEINYYKEYIEVLFPTEINSSLIYYEKPYVIINQHLLSVMIENLKHRKIYNYGMLNDINVKIYATEQNIQILKENYQKEEEAMNHREEEDDKYCSEELRDYESQVSQLEQEKEALLRENIKLENEKEELKSSNLEYQDKIEDYKRRLQQIIEE